MPHTRPRTPATSKDASALLRIAVELEAQGEALARIESKLDRALSGRNRQPKNRRRTQNA